MELENTMFDLNGFGTSMRLYHKSFKPQKRCSAIFRCIKGFQSFFQCRLYQKCTDLTSCAGHHSFFDLLDQGRNRKEG